MAQIYAGTGYGQLMAIDYQSKKREKQFYGALQREKITEIYKNKYEPNLVFYTNTKKIFQLDTDNGENKEVVNLYQSKNKIIGFKYNQVTSSVQYGLSNGAVVSTSTLI